MKDFPLAQLELRSPPLRSSALDTRDWCLRAFLLQERYGIQGRGYNSSLHIGTLVHKGFEALVGGGELPAAFARMDSYGAAELKKVIAEGGFFESPSALATELSEDCALAQALLTAVWTLHPIDWTRFRIWEGCIEETFEVLIQDYRAKVKPDIILEEISSGDLYIVDYKTCGIDANLRAEAARLSVQMPLYKKAVEIFCKNTQKFVDKKVVGFIQYILRKPTIKYCPLTKDKAQDGQSSLSRYIGRVKEWYATSDKVHILRLEQPFVPDKHGELDGRVADFIRLATIEPDLGVFYRVGGSGCIRYNRACKYMRLCGSDESLWPSLIEDHYKVEFREDVEAAE